MKKSRANDELVDRVRRFLAHQPNVLEKKMFGRTAFMLNDKLCITAGTGRIMLRIDPAELEKLLEMPGTSAVTMKNRVYKGFIHVDESELAEAKNLRFWLNKALIFNKQQLIQNKQAAANPSKKMRNATKKR